MTELKQYKACMGIMLCINANHINEIKYDFERHKNGLTLDEFIAVMLRRLTWTQDSVVFIIRDLIELFEQIDVNDDKNMEWNEFMNFIIEAGMGNIGEKRDWRDLCYEKLDNFVDTTSRQPIHCEYINELQYLFIYEGNRPVLQVYDTSSLIEENSLIQRKIPIQEKKQQIQIDSFNDYPFISSETSIKKNIELKLNHQIHPLSYLTGYRYDQDELRSERSPIQTMLYIPPPKDILIISPGDLTLTVWNPNTLLKNNKTDNIVHNDSNPMINQLNHYKEINLTPLFVLTTSHPYRLLRYCINQSTLVTCAADNIIHLWKINGNNKKCEIVFFDRLLKHDDIIQDILIFNDYLMISCGLDNKIIFWDTDLFQYKSTRFGHERGVRILAKCSNNLFASSGFENDIFIWDITGSSNTPLFKLSGHSCPIISMQSVPDQISQLISCDESGCFRWWNVMNSTTIENTERCYQTFSIYNKGKYPWKPNSFTILNQGSYIIATGFKMKVFKRVPLKPFVSTSIDVLFNNLSFNLFTTSLHDIQVWDALTGDFIIAFRNLSPLSEITSIQMDTRQRKFFIGNQNGIINVFNCINGAQVKKIEPGHRSQVSSIIYSHQDKCIITSSWDKSIHLYDDNDHEKPFLRSIRDAHETDITCMSFSSSYGLIATGSMDGKIKIWDYFYFLQEGECFPSQSEVFTLSFVDPYPLLISGHAVGLICIWSIQNLIIEKMNEKTTSTAVFHHYDLLYYIKIPNVLSNITVIKYFYNKQGGKEIKSNVFTEKYLLFVGNEVGEISIHNLYNLIKNNMIKVDAITQEELLQNKRNYNLRRRLHREGKTLKTKLFFRNYTSMKAVDGMLITERTLLDSKSKNADKMTQRISNWVAHQLGIRNITILGDEEDGLININIKYLITCSDDKCIYAWSFDGILLGTLVSENIHKNQLRWELQIDSEANNTKKLAVAKIRWENFKSSSAICNGKDENNQIDNRLSHDISISNNEHKKQNHPTLNYSLSLPNLQLHNYSLINKEISGNTTVITSNNEGMGENKDLDLLRKQISLFKQFNGEQTWLKSSREIAREAAWEKEKEKNRQKFKKLLKKKKKEKLLNGSFIINQNNLKEKSNLLQNQNQVMNSMDTSSDNLVDDKTEIDMNMNNPPENYKQPGFYEEDNWTLNSYNRQKLLYKNLFDEFNRGKLKKEKFKLESFLPSSFLIDKLGSETIHSKITLEKNKIQRNLSTSAIPIQVISTLDECTSENKNKNHKDFYKKNNKIKYNKQLPRVITPIHTKADRIEVNTCNPEQIHSKIDIINKSSDIVNKSESNYKKENYFEQNSQDSLHLLEMKTKYLKLADYLDNHDDSRFYRDRIDTLKYKDRKGLKTINTMDDNGISRNNRRNRKNSLLTITKEQLSHLQKNKRILSTIEDKNTHDLHRKGVEKDISLNNTVLKNISVLDDKVLKQKNFGIYPRKDVAEICHLFNKIDKDNNGFIEMKEFTSDKFLCGSDMIRENIKSIFHSVDMDHNGNIELVELLKVLFPQANRFQIQDMIHFAGLLKKIDILENNKKNEKLNVMPASILQDLTDLFHLYDYDKNGTIDLNELVEAFSLNKTDHRTVLFNETMNDKGLTLDDIKKLFLKLNKKENDNIKLDEFIEIFRDVF